jgi:hypothetical protein
MKKISEDPTVTSENQAFMREDKDNYCPRRGEQVLILGGTCFCKDIDCVCSGCVFDSEPRVRIRVKLIWLMSEILQESGLEKRQMFSMAEARRTRC